MALGTAAAGAATWQPVPGAPEVAVDLDSLQSQRQRVLAWVRWPGRAPLPVEGLSAPTGGPRVYRSAQWTEFDCQRRTVRALATNAWDNAGRPVYMATVPGVAQPLPAGDLAWTWDALCELQRGSGRG